MPRNKGRLKGGDEVCQIRLKSGHYNLGHHLIDYVTKANGEKAAERVSPINFCIEYLATSTTHQKFKAKYVYIFYKFLVLSYKVHTPDPNYNYNCQKNRIPNHH